MRGGARLEGSVATHGAKNAALPIMAARLLTQGQGDAPPRPAHHRRLGDVVAARSARRPAPLEGDNTLTIDACNVRTLPRAVRAGAQARRFVRRRRAAAGPLRARRGSAARRLRARDARDRHARGRRSARSARRAQRARLPHRRARRNDACSGATIEFRMPSVGATKNAMLAAVAGRRDDDDRQRRDGARSRRPRELPRRDGREDRGSGHRHDRRSTACSELHGVEYEIIPDRIVTGTLLLAGAVTRGDVTVTRCRPRHSPALARQAASSAAS